MSPNDILLRPVIRKGNGQVQIGAALVGVLIHRYVPVSRAPNAFFIPMGQEGKKVRIRELGPSHGGPRH
jgi:hypothetical protein